MTGQVTLWLFRSAYFRLGHVRTGCQVRSGNVGVGQVRKG